MAKMRWLVGLVMVLSVCVYCTIADEPEQDRMEYDNTMPVDYQAERDDNTMREDDMVDRMDSDYDDDNKPMNANRQEESDTAVAKVQSWNAVSTRYRSANIQFTHVSTSINYYWGTDRRQRIYRCARPCNGAWVQIPGGLQQVDVGDMEVWGVNSGNAIYKRSADGAGNWIRVGGSLKHVSASGNGYIWGVNRYDNIYMCKKPCSGRWTQISGKLKQIDGGERYVFGVNSANNMYRRRVDNRSSWRYIPSRIKMKYVSVGADMIYGVGASDSKVYQCRLPCTSGAFTAIDTCLNMKQVEATLGEIVGTTASGQIMKRSVA